MYIQIEKLPQTQPSKNLQVQVILFPLSTYLIFANNLGIYLFRFEGKQHQLNFFAVQRRRKGNRIYSQFW